MRPAENTRVWRKGTREVIHAPRATRATKRTAQQNVRFDRYWSERVAAS